jgi:hypothetical protein
MLSGHFYDPPDPTMRGTVADRPVVELVLALVDDDGRVYGNPTRTRVAMCYEEGDFAEAVLDGATTLQEVLTRLLGQLNGQPKGLRRSGASSPGRPGLCYVADPSGAVMGAFGPLPG